MFASTSIAPPVVELGRLAGWSPLPLSVRDARRLAGDLTERLRAATPPVTVGAVHGDLVAEARGVVVRYAGAGGPPALRGVDLRLRAGEVVALMGRNGAGKSTLLSALVGLRRPDAGSVTVAGADPAALTARDLVRRVGMVPQEPGDLLYATTVAEECDQADRDAGVPVGTALEIFVGLVDGADPQRHPRDLSEGQRLALALAVVLAGAPGLVLLDEPTRGLDYRAKERLVLILRDLAARGHTVVLATHDVELAAEVAERVVVLADGEVVADGPVRDVLAGSPAFAPQVAKIVHPLPFLTVAEVTAALEPAS